MNIKEEEEMKKFLVVLFALGLIAAFSQPAAAVDVKFSGSYFVQGFYDDNHSLGDEDESSSSAFYAQRLRLKTIFQVTEGLRLTTRCDIMEKVWGADRYGLAGESFGYGPETDEATFKKDDEENIDFDRVYVSFDVPIGTFHVGYMWADGWGTVFGNNYVTKAGIKFVNTTGPWTTILHAKKYSEGDIGDDETDNDADEYDAAVVYTWGAGNAGLLYRYINDNRSENSDFEDRWVMTPARDYDIRAHVLSPYVKATIGPVYVEAQLYYMFGDDALEYESGVAGNDEDADALSAYIMANVDLGQFYVGGQFAYVQGDEPGDGDYEAGYSGNCWDPCLIFGSFWLNKWQGASGTDNGADYGVGGSVENALLYQIFAGVKPIEKLNVRVSATYIEPDEEVNGNDDEYGTEFDITATYKIYDNLSYMVGFGYLCAGDYFEGPDAARGDTDDNYLVVNKLTLTF